MSDEHTQDPPKPSALSPVGRLVRVAITLTVTALIVATTFWGADDYFPFAPMKMYSFSKSLDGRAGSTRVEAVNEEGVRFKLTEHNTGFRRAEVEGQMSFFRDDPTNLQYLAEAYENANPDKPEVVTVEIIVRRYHLKDGKPTGDVTETIEATWTRERVDA